MNQRPWQPPQANNTPPPGAISIQDLLSMYGFLHSLPQPHSELITKTLTNFETVIHNFSQQISTGAAQ